MTFSIMTLSIAQFFCVKWNELAYQGLVPVTASFKFKLTVTIILEQNDAKEKLGRTKVVSDKNISLQKNLKLELFNLRKLL